jgi:polyferredoxin
MGLTNPTTQWVISELTQIASVVIAIITIILARTPAMKSQKLKTVRTHIRRRWLRYLLLLLFSLTFAPAIIFVALAFWNFDRIFSIILLILTGCLFLLVPLSVLALVLGEPTP